MQFIKLNGAVIVLFILVDILIVTLQTFFSAHPSGAPEFTPVFNVVRVTRSLVLYVCFVDHITILLSGVLTNRVSNQH